MRLFALAATLLATVSLQAAPALAQTPLTCAGRSLVDELQERDPARLQAAFARGRASFANLGARLWRIERPGVATSYLFGTIHSGDPRIRPLPAELTRALAGARVVALELREIAEGEAAQQAMANRIAGAAMDFSTDSIAFLTPPERAELERGLEARGIPMFMARSMRPWFLGMLLALPSCELRRASAGRHGVDEQVAAARSRQAELVGLETVDGQIGEIAAMPLEVARHSLAWSARNISREEDIFATLIDLYNRGEVGALIEIVVAAGLATEADRDMLLSYIRHVSQRRDPILTERALPHLAQGNAVIAVGALHLVGEGGLVERFRRAGYTLTPVE
jgi:uncharacterized protein YbaP (TraB family)